MTDLPKITELAAGVRIYIVDFWIYQQGTNPSDESAAVLAYSLEEAIDRICIKRVDGRVPAPTLRVLDIRPPIPTEIRWLDVRYAGAPFALRTLIDMTDLAKWANDYPEEWK